ncbi:MAG TPA: PIN domain-containing protein [Anaeromyxobacteraceae bacterium]|nr:PIN domain-containing protein [Anaeromyxobacteraceae bacterium]
MTLADTTVLVNVEKGQPLALATVAELLEAGELAVSTVTAHELLRSPRLPPPWRAFWLDFLASVDVLDLDLAAAEAAAAIWASRRSQNEKPDLGDVLIAGTALAVGCDAITDGEGFAALVGARLVRPS